MDKDGKPQGGHSAIFVGWIDGEPMVIEAVDKGLELVSIDEVTKRLRAEDKKELDDTKNENPSHHLLPIFRSLKNPEAVK